jgi:hypothetical protein
MPVMGVWKRIKPPLEAAEHVHFIDLVLQALFDWRTYVLPILGAAVTFLKAAIDGRDPLDVWVLAVVVAAGLAIVVAVGVALWQAFWPHRSNAVAQRAPISEHDRWHPNVRIADNPAIHESLLKGPDREKFLGLLSAGKLWAWGRHMRGHSGFSRIPADMWDTHYIFVHLNSGLSVTGGGQRTHHQTYLRKAGGHDSLFYDICVNQAQMLDVWPEVQLTLDDGSGG